VITSVAVEGTGVTVVVIVELTPSEYTVVVAKAARVPAFVTVVVAGCE